VNAGDDTEDAMADDDPIDDEDFEEGELDEELDADDLGDDEADDGLDEGDEGDGGAADDAVDEAVEEEEEAPPARAKREDDEEDDEADPDDVEADLDTILKDRIAAADDEDEEDEEVVPEPRATGEVAEGVTPKKANEFMCTGCFLLVNPGQFGAPGHMTCPVGEAVCPAIEQLEAKVK
jgi:hypothetical protein